MGETLTPEKETNGKIQASETERTMGTGGRDGGVRAVVDTSAPFESVKEAVNRFGGVGYWKPASNGHISKFSPSKDGGEASVEKLEQQAAHLEKDLMKKERETLDVLKELESTKLLVDELKSKLQKEASELNIVLERIAEDRSINPEDDGAEKENHCEAVCTNKQKAYSCPSSAPGFILMELKQAKLNLARTTSDLADIRASVESFNKKLEKEKASLEKTRERLAQGTAKMSSLEEELNQTRLKLCAAKDVETWDEDGALSITREIHRLSSEAEQFKKVSEAAKMAVQRAISEIELTRTKITTAEKRLTAARKMKEAARASESLALAEIKALSKHERSSSELVTLTLQDYSSLTRQAQGAEEECKKRIEEATVQVEEENLSKAEVLRKIEEATEEVKISKKALEEALIRVEAANREKLTVEEALRKWRSDHGRKRRSSRNLTKFKNSYPPANHKRDTRVFELNGPEPDIEVSKPALKQTLSIGQILSRKLLLAEDFQSGAFPVKGTMKRNVSLGQMLSQDGVASSLKASKEPGHKQFSSKRKKFGFGRVSLLLTKQSKKKKLTLV